MLAPKLTSSDKKVNRSAPKRYTAFDIGAENADLAAVVIAELRHE